MGLCLRRREPAVHVALARATSRETSRWPIRGPRWRGVAGGSGASSCSATMPHLVGGGDRHGHRGAWHGWPSAQIDGSQGGVVRPSHDRRVHDRRQPGRPDHRRHVPLAAFGAGGIFVTIRPRRRTEATDGGSTLDPVAALHTDGGDEASSPIGLSWPRSNGHPSDTSPRCGSRAWSWPPSRLALPRQGRSDGARSPVRHPRRVVLLVLSA